jgi:TrmH family RNA methyltransferase
MGAADIVPWRRAGPEELQSLAEDGSIFALELGGTPLRDFRFPKTGIVIVGSEELGVSAGILGLCGLGKVSIPMAGAKASLNAGVAFGILMAAWADSLDSGTKIMTENGG